MASKLREGEDKGDLYLPDKKKSNSDNSATAGATEIDSFMTKSSSSSIEPSTLSKGDFQPMRSNRYVTDSTNVSTSEKKKPSPAHESHLNPNERLTSTISSLPANSGLKSESPTDNYDASVTDTVSDNICGQELSGNQPGKKNSSTAMIAIKFLVSNNMAGSIIGRSGKTISDLQVQSSSRIKLSQSGACYPGTADRVCLIQGQIENVKKALSLILQQLYDIYHQQIAQQQSSNYEAGLLNKEIGNIQQESTAEREVGFDLIQGNEPSRIRQDLSRHILPSDTRCEPMYGGLPPQKLPSFVVRLLIPTACSGMIIGRGGCNVKSIAETSGVASIRLAPKEGDDAHQTIVQGMQQQQAAPSMVLVPSIQATSERIMTITGQDLSCCVKCCHLILENLALQPELSRYTNMTTNYIKSTVTTNTTFVTSPANTNTIEPISSLVINATPASTLTNKSPNPMSQQQQQSLPPSKNHQFPPTNTLGFPSPQQLPNIGVAGILGHHHSATMLQYGGNTSYPSIETTPSQSNASVIIPTAHIPINSISPDQGSYNSSHQQQPPIPQPLYLVASSPSPGSMFVHAVPASIANNSTIHINRESSDPTIINSGMHSEQNLSSSMVESRGSSHNMIQHFGSSQSSDRNRGEALLQTNTPPSQNSCLKDDIIPQDDQQLSTRQITAPDCLIGAILGRRGSTLTELQHTTNTKIKISQRGVFVPGTKDRIVTISGPSPINVSNAQYLISQRLAQAANRIRTTNTLAQYSTKPKKSNPSSLSNQQVVQNTLNQGAVVNREGNTFDCTKKSPSNVEGGLNSTKQNLNPNDQSNQ